MQEKAHVSGGPRATIIYTYRLTAIPPSRFSSRRKLCFHGFFGLSLVSSGRAFAPAGRKPQGFHDSIQLFSECHFLCTQFLNPRINAADFACKQCFLLSSFQVELPALALCQ